MWYIIEVSCIHTYTHVYVYLDLCQDVSSFRPKTPHKCPPKKPARQQPQPRSSSTRTSHRRPQFTRKPQAVYGSLYIGITRSHYRSLWTKQKSHGKSIRLFWTLLIVCLLEHFFAARLFRKQTKNRPFLGLSVTRTLWYNLMHATQGFMTQDVKILSFQRSSNVDLICFTHGPWVDSFQNLQTRTIYRSTIPKANN